MYGVELVLGSLDTMLAKAPGDSIHSSANGHLCKAEIGNFKPLVLKETQKTPFFGNSLKKSPLLLATGWCSATSCALSGLDGFGGICSSCGAAIW